MWGGCRYWNFAVRARFLVCGKLRMEPKRTRQDRKNLTSRTVRCKFSAVNKSSGRKAQQKIWAKKTKYSYDCLESKNLHLSDASTSVLAKNYNTKKRSKIINSKLLEARRIVATCLFWVESFRTRRLPIYFLSVALIRAKNYRLLEVATYLWLMFNKTHIYQNAISSSLH